MLPIGHGIDPGQAENPSPMRLYEAAKTGDTITNQMRSTLPAVSGIASRNIAHRSFVLTGESPDGLS